MSFTPWRSSTWFALTVALALVTLLIHGYHPLAEDGGLYVAGVQYTLNPSLFPHSTAFVTEHLRFSLFAPTLALLTRLCHLPLDWVLLLVTLSSLTLTFYAARQLLRRCNFSDAAQLAGLALLAAWATLPVAGTSLFLIDPYLTARSLSTPLSLLSIAYALQDAHSLRRLLSPALGLGAAALFHPLMAAYAFALVLCLYLSRSPRPRLALAILTTVALSLAAALNAAAPTESTALIAAEITRYYWFLSQWQWFELLGLAGPLLVLAALLRWPQPLLSSHTHPQRHLIRASIALGLLAVLVATLFAHQDSPTHLVARLQPLRVFLLIYALLPLLLGASLMEVVRKHRQAAQTSFARRAFLLAPPMTLALLASIMFLVQRETFPSSPHLEFPGRSSPNPWVRAFVWARTNTPQDALFALDAHYITTAGEDAQTFRATAQRSALPDYSKDGGEAAITPSLAPLWQQGYTAQLNLSTTPDRLRDARLRPLGVTWLLLTSASATAHRCPYDNGVIKLCLLTP